MFEQNIVEYDAKKAKTCDSLVVISPHWDYMTVFSAYLDDSGTHDDSPLTIVGGIILSEQGSNDLQKAWRDTLIKYGVEVFHGADCDAGYGEFGSWPRQKSHELSLELATIVSSYATGIIAYGVKPKDFNTAWEELSLREIGIKNHVYRILLQLCFHKLGVFAHELPADDGLEIFVEKGNKRASFINDLYQKVNDDRQARDILNIKQITFAGKESSPLQAADLLVHKIFKYHPNWGTDVMGDALRELTKNRNEKSIMLLGIDEIRTIMAELQKSDKNFIKRKHK